MKLYEGSTGKTYIIRSVNGDGRILRRLEAMGVRKDTKIVLLNKKQKGSVIIKSRGTRLALGKSIAGGIEIQVPEGRSIGIDQRSQPRRPDGPSQPRQSDDPNWYNLPRMMKFRKPAQSSQYGLRSAQSSAPEKSRCPERPRSTGSRPLTVAFVGNPNCGKTTLFNAFTGARLKVANWPGVTVERIEGETFYQGRKLRLLDTPGVYSLDSYTMEEMVTRRCLETEDIDVIVNVVDASALERNLYLTLQLLKLNKPMVLALNMMDLVKERGIEIDLSRLSESLGNIFVAPVSARTRTGLEALLKMAVEAADFPQVKRRSAVGADYDYIETVLQRCLYQKEKTGGLTERIDRVLTHRVWGIPAFFCVMALIFFLTFTVGDFFKGYFEKIMEIISSELLIDLRRAGASDWLISMVVDGIAAGVGGILTFLPNIAILFLALAFLEDSGYMSRVAYVMNETMNMVGLSGKAFLPMLLGFGCTVPAVMASRTLENRKDRLRTILMTPFMSCSARLPIYILFAGLFFPETAVFVAGSLYLLGVLTAIAIGFLIHKASGEDEEGTLLMELPEYRQPNGRTVAVYVWEKVKDYLTRAGTTIFLASITLWFLLHAGPSGFASDVSQSFAARIGVVLEPVLAPAGLGQWQTAVALISGLSAKEVVVSSYCVLFGVSGADSAAGMAQLSAALTTIGFGKANAYALMVFSLLYTPCMAAVAAIRRESGSLKWTVGMILFQLILAWTAAALTFQAGTSLAL